MKILIIVPKVGLFLLTKLVDFFTYILMPISIILQALLQTTGSTAKQWELLCMLIIGASAGTYLTNKVEHLVAKDIYLRAAFAFATGYAARKQFVKWFPSFDLEFVYLMSGFSMLVILSIVLKFLKDFEMKAYLTKFFEQKTGIKGDNKAEEE